MLRLSLAGLGVVGRVAAAEPADPKEARAMDGPWELVSAELGGRKRPAG